MNAVVSVPWLKEHLHDAELIVLDTSMQPSDELIPNARYFDLKNVFRNTESELPNTVPSPEKFQEAAQALGISASSQVIVYDNKGIYTSPRAWWLFRLMGHQKIAVLDGGLPAWLDADLPTTTTTKASTYVPGDFKVSYQAQLIKSMDFVLKNLDSRKALLLDARSAERFHGQAPEPRAGLPSGHIPQACSLPYTQVLHNGHFKSKAELTAIFNTMLTDPQPLVFTCGSGITACIIYLAYFIVHEKDQAVFDGSWTEWALQETAPIAQRGDFN